MSHLKTTLNELLVYGKNTITLNISHYINQELFLEPHFCSVLHLKNYKRLQISKLDFALYQVTEMENETNNVLTGTIIDQNVPTPVKK